jgi:ribonuclease HI
VTTESGETLIHRGTAIDWATNNIAEWTGFVDSLQAAIEVGAREVILHTDSQLVARQFRGTYSVSEAFQPFVARAHALAAKLDRVEVREIQRELNKVADAICTSAWPGRMFRSVS